MQAGDHPTTTNHKWDIHVEHAQRTKDIVQQRSGIHNSTLLHPNAVHHQASPNQEYSSDSSDPALDALAHPAITTTKGINSIAAVSTNTLAQARDHQLQEYTHHFRHRRSITQLFTSTPRFTIYASQSAIQCVRVIPIPCRKWAFVHQYILPQYTDETSVFQTSENLASPTPPLMNRFGRYHHAYPKASRSIIVLL